MTNRLRITGMASGLDVESTVKSLMKAENMRLDKIKQGRQSVQWKQDIYRDLLGDINIFGTTYLNSTKPDSNMLSLNNYSGYDASSVDSASTTATPTATATAGVGATAGTYSVVVNNIAKAATIEGTSIANNKEKINLTAVDGSGNLTDWSGKKISFNVDGNDCTVTLSDNIKTLDDLVTDINLQIGKSDSLKGKISITKLGADSIQIDTSSFSTIKINDNADTTVGISGIQKGRAINPTADTKLSDLGLSADTKINLTYNGVTKGITLKTTDRIFELINNISSNTSNGVTAKYSELTGKITLQTETGSNTSLSIDPPIGKLGLSGVDGVSDGTKKSVSGEDAEVIITPPNGVATKVTKSKNSFTIDGMSYNLQSADNTKTSKITVTSNPQKTFDKIKALIDKYNEVIEKIQTKITEKKQYAYKPLTDDQKKDMKEDEIKAWETRAKEGALKNDSSLQGMLYAMRSAFFEGVKDAGITLNQVGLSTSADYLKGGKIIIDETKLKDAIKNNGEKVANLFMKDSSIRYNADHKITGVGPNDPIDPTGQKQYLARNSEIGIFRRIDDVLKDYTRTNRDSNNRKGILLVKAGIKGDASEFDNLLSDDIKKNYDKKITDLTKKLSDKEDSYYRKFSQLESAMQKMNSQSNWLAQQLGGK